MLLMLVAGAGFASDDEVPEITIDSSNDLRAVLDDADSSSLASELDFGLTPDKLLWEGAREGDTDKVRAQLEAGADIDYLGPFQSTALLISVKEGHSDVIELLVSEGANVDARTTRSWPLSLAIENADHATVQLLVEADAKLEAADEDGHTALMLAAREGHADMVRLFLDNGAKINEETYGEDAHNALLIAVEQGHVDIVELLLEYGASTEMKDGTPGVAADYALEQRERLRRILKLLQSRD